LIVGLLLLSRQIQPFAVALSNSPPRGLDRQHYHVKLLIIVEHVYADVAVVPYDEKIGSSIAHSKI
jgi:hypothetical protein